MVSALGSGSLASALALALAFVFSALLGSFPVLMFSCFHV